jgi:hypothetical protein
MNRTRLLEADAVMFRARALDRRDLPSPKKRGSDQLYVVYEIEPPHKTWRFINLTKYNGFFNLTATYAWDSDIPMGQHRSFVLNQKKYDELRGVDFASKKRTGVPVAWFVSRCPTQSRREDYVKEMQKYIAVDVYGQCGNLTCHLKGAHFKDDECVRRLLGGKDSYKFYLAFENSLCEDYVTEKIWKVVGTRVIPVVMGAVDYKRMFPPKTFIDVRDFKSPKDLALFLLSLHQNDAEYNEYMRRKMALNSYVPDLFPRQCIFCRYLHLLKGTRSVAYAMDDFWGSRRCIRPDVFFDTHDDNDFGLDLKQIKSWGSEMYDKGGVQENKSENPKSSL